MSNTFIASWDIYGLECLINVTECEQENMISILKEEPIKHRNPLQHMILRAQFNPQRHYEIYAFESEMDEVSIRDVFENSPQAIVDFIRENGKKLYSDHENLDRRVIV